MKTRIRNLKMSIRRSVESSRCIMCPTVIYVYLFEPQMEVAVSIYELRWIQLGINRSLYQ